MHKREFLKKAATFGLTVPFGWDAFARSFEEVSNLGPAELASEDAFWENIRNNYLLTPEYINLESGYYCMLPEPLLEKYIYHIHRVNREHSHYMRKSLNKEKKQIIDRLAIESGCSPDELAITRNTTESLDLVINGIHWKKGDEAVMALQDYGAMLNMFRLMEERYGINLRKVSLPNDPQSDDEIVDLYRSQITEKTKLLMVCHMVNITGQVLPVRKICDMAHGLGVQVMVDGAHSFAHVRTSMRDLDCDYYGTSLHKWLSAPLGNGLLYVKKERIPELWPLLAEDKKEPGDIKRLSHTGTTPVHTMMGIVDAIDHFHMIGAQRKTERLRYLQRYWSDRVRDLPKVIMNTPRDPDRSCAIANVGIEGIPPKQLAQSLMDEFNIWTVGIDRPGVKGCRITPNVYTTTSELDALVDAITKLSHG